MADKIVNIDTDNLDDFEALLSGTATAAPVEEAPAPVEEVDEPDPEVDTLAEPNEENEEADPDPEEDKALFVPKKKTVQERINELTAARKEAERREAALQERLDALEAAGKKADPVVTEAPVSAVGEPTPDDVQEDGELKYPLGEYDPKYIRDLMKFTIEQETKARDTQAEIDRQAALQAEREADVKAQQDALKEDWAGRVTAVIETVPDFVDKVQTLEQTFTTIDPSYGEYLATTIMSMEQGTDVLYYLSNNLEEAQRIANLGPVQATIALGRIEAKFEKGEEPKQPKVSEAPEPPGRPLKGSSTVHKVAPDTDDLEAFEKEFFRRK